MGSHAPRAGTTSPYSSSSSSAASSSNEESHRVHVVLLRDTLHEHGHTSPMLLQFSHQSRLVLHGLRPMLVIIHYIILPNSLGLPSPFHVAAISDGFNDAGHA